MLGRSARKTSRCALKRFGASLNEGSLPKRRHPAARGSVRKGKPAWTKNAQDKPLRSANRVISVVNGIDVLEPGLVMDIDELSKGER
jgi:hypothetical protein